MKTAAQLLICLFLLTCSLRPLVAEPITIDTGTYTFTSTFCFLNVNQFCTGPTNTASGNTMVISDNGILDIGYYAVFGFQIIQDGGWTNTPAIDVQFGNYFTGLGIAHTLVSYYDTTDAPQDQYGATYADWHNMQFNALAPSGNEPVNVTLEMYFAVGAIASPDSITVSIAPGTVAVAPEPSSLLLVLVAAAAYVLFLYYKRRLRHKHKRNLKRLLWMCVFPAVMFAQTSTPTPSSTPTPPMPKLTDSDKLKLVTISADLQTLILRSQQLDQQQTQLHTEYNRQQQLLSDAIKEIESHYKLCDGCGVIVPPVGNSLANFQIGKKAEKESEKDRTSEKAEKK